jgi:hypothetical protein
MGAEMDQPACFEHYNAAWNEREIERIAGHLDQAVSDDVVFIDPANQVVGRDELLAMIVKARQELPTADYLLVSGIDGHHGRYRYLWEARLDGAVLTPGMDVTRVGDDGRIAMIEGFFGDFPALPTL